MIAVFAVLIASQIDAGPSPSELGQILRTNRYGIERGMMGPGMMGPGANERPKPFPIARYLFLAEYLQQMQERERVTWLRMAAGSKHLAAPSVFVARMLIESKDERPLRTIRAEVGAYRDGEPAALLPDSPLELFEGVPFCVDGGGSGTGISENPGTYLEYLLANGKWRDGNFKRRNNDELKAVANRYFEHLRGQGFAVSESFRRDVLSQCEVPLQGERKPERVFNPYSSAPTR